MLELRKARDRGHARHGWLESFHTFSFAEYHDPGRMGFRTLRVLNEDRVEPRRGFGKHSHCDMEILTYVLDGELEHGDSLGNGSVIRPGDVQRMSAGTGITHSENNPSDTEQVHFLQIWILPERDGLEPSYEQRHFPAEERAGRLRVVASRDGRDGSVRIHQDAAMYAGLLSPGQAVEHRLALSRYVWIQLARGAVEANGIALTAGDGLAVWEETGVALRATAPAELLLLDLG